MLLLDLPAPAEHLEPQTNNTTHRAGIGHAVTEACTALKGTSVSDLRGQAGREAGSRVCMLTPLHSSCTHRSDLCTACPCPQGCSSASRWSEIVSHTMAAQGKSAAPQEFVCPPIHPPTTMPPIRAPTTAHCSNPGGAGRGRSGTPRRGSGACAGGPWCTSPPARGCVH